MEIDGKTAVITGGASGLGEATARRLHGLGANVLIADINEEKGAALCSELGSKAAFAKMNVTETQDVQAGMDLAMEKFKAIHILVNCAGTGFAMRTVGKNGPHDIDVFKMIVNINLIGTFDAIRLAAFRMQENEPENDARERGVIVNTASAAAFDGQIGQASYSASKAGVVGMTLPIARDLSVMGIRICTIAPGIFDTPLMQALSEEGKASLAQQIPFPKRFGKPDEYAMMTQQIVENPMMNGESIRLDGAIRMGPK
ncbi:MAG: 3-hydroxyacyl-CoA dehydrogenase [Proteobacteria bacterium]|nr:3-hydroxyacyl-CoA dehydrogenase [Pseudomonadota bacterium]